MKTKHKTIILLISAAVTTTAAYSADLRTFEGALASDVWTWTKTKADQETLPEPVPVLDVNGNQERSSNNGPLLFTNLAPVTHPHIGNLQDGLRSNSGNASTLLKLRTGPARIDNGLPQSPPEPYKTATGTTYAYPVPASYTGVFGLYAGDVSAYSAFAFPGAVQINSGTYTQSALDSYLGGGGWTNPTSPEEAAAYSRFDISIDDVHSDTQKLIFQIRIQGMGPTLENQANGTYLTNYDVVHQISPITLTWNGDQFLDFTSSELLSYENLGVGNRHAYAPGGYEELWQFEWDFSTIGDTINSIDLSFTNYPTSVITGLAVTQLVPEPSTYALIFCGLGLVAIYTRRRRNTQQAA